MENLSLLLLWLVLLISLGGLYAGGELLVSGGVALANRLGIRKVVIGLTVVAMGTSMPEFFVSLFGALKGSSDISVGNVVGSNLANIGLALGLSVLIRKEVGRLKEVVWDLLFLSVMTAALWGMGLDREVSGWEGGLLFTGLIFYIFASSKRKRLEMEEEKSLSYPLALISVGIALLSLAANYTVKSGILISQKMGITTLAIGMTAMALGTSLPEISVSLVAAVRREGGIGVGNVVGSNIFNLLGVLGGVSLIKPLDINKNLLTVYIPASLGFTLFLLLLAVLRGRMDRRHSLLLLVAYFILMYYLFR